MSFLPTNIRYLRNELSYSQQKVADDLMITRGRYAKYEDGASEPPLEILLRISRYYHVSIDLLLSVDIRNIALKEIIELPDNRIVLPIRVDNSGENVIEIIPHKASMGYLSGYSDPEYIESLQSISLPFLGIGKYRAFPVQGDSMPPHKDNAYIIGRYLDNLQDLKVGKTYVWITRNEGITYKRLSGIFEEGLELQADNPFYAPYFVPYYDIMEIWEYASSLAMEEFHPSDFAWDKEMFIAMFQDLKKEIRDLKK